MAIECKLAALAERLDELAAKLNEEWRQRELRIIAMTPHELAGLQQWKIDFVKHVVLKKQNAAGQLLEAAWQAGAFREDATFVSEVTGQQSRPITNGRHAQIFLGLWRRWLPTKGISIPCRSDEALGYHHADAFTAFADLLRGDGSRQEPTQRKGVTRFDAALVLQAMTDAEQSDQERRNAAYEMAQRWGKLRSIKWDKLVIGIDPGDGQGWMFDAADLVTALADSKEAKWVIQFGGEKKLTAKLRKKEREPLPVEQSVKLIERRTTRTTRTLAKSRKSSSRRTREKSRLV